MTQSSLISKHHIMSLAPRQPRLNVIAPLSMTHFVIIIIIVSASSRIASLGLNDVIVSLHHPRQHVSMSSLAEGALWRPRSRPACGSSSAVIHIFGGDGGASSAQA